MEGLDLARRWAAAQDPYAALARARAELVAADDARLPVILEALGVWVAGLALSAGDALVAVRVQMGAEINNPAAAGVVHSAELAALVLEVANLHNEVAATGELLRDQDPARRELIRLREEAELLARQRTELDRELTDLTEPTGGAS